MPSLASLSHGFRSDYLSYDAITAQLRAWATAYPEICQLTSIGATPEGRELWLLTIGREPARIRPAAWVDGNMHASELAGSSVSLAIAEEMLRIHLEPTTSTIPAQLHAVLREMLIYVLPRMSPDGAEAIVTGSRFVRSVPRDERIARATPRWIFGDVDGDGTSFLMRKQDPTGEMVEARDIPGVLVERTIDDGDVGPFYKVFPEGHIEHFDGRNIPSPYFMSDNPIDLNRNFPWSWTPTHEQAGAGAFPTSEPEARAVVEFTCKHPEIFAWLNLHTFGGVTIRPFGHAPDSKMNQEDLAVFRQLEAWMTEHTGYPTVSGYEEFLYEPDKPLHGDLTDYAYNQRGAMAYVVELWDIFARIGMPKPKKFVDYYEHFTRENLHALATWDAAHNKSRIFRPWKKVSHPQLGEVEVGGVDPRFGIWNPPHEELTHLCEQHTAAFLRVAALSPRIVVAETTCTTLGDGITRIDVKIENRGYLGSYGLPSAKALDFNEPVHATVATHGVELVDNGGPHRTLGHLDGWGHGLHTGTNMPSHLHTRGSTGTAYVSYFVRVSSESPNEHRGVELTIGSARCGFQRVFMPI